MSKKEKEEIKEEIKEKTDEPDPTVVDETKVEATLADATEPKENSAVVEEKVDANEATIEVATKLEDPFSDWTTIFGEFHKEMPPEAPDEDPAWLTRDEIQMIAREEIKEWVTGVQEGKYPMPTGIIQTVDSTLTEAVTPFPEKEFESVQKEIVEIKKSKEDEHTRLDEIMKSLEVMKKEIEVIRDTPIEVVEKSIAKDTEYESTIAISRDGHISKRK